MCRKLIKTIIYDLADNEELVNFILNNPTKNLFLCHFGAGMYIRNKYLWTHPENCELLAEYFDTNDIDNISSKLLHLFTEHVHVFNKEDEANDDESVECDVM